MAGGYGNGHRAWALHARDLPAALIVNRHAAHVAAHHDAAVVHHHFGRSRAYLADAGRAALLACDAHGINLHGVAIFAHEAESDLHGFAGKLLQRQFGEMIRTFAVIVKKVFQTIVFPFVENVIEFRPLATRFARHDFERRGGFAIGERPRPPINVFVVEVEEIQGRISVLESQFCLFTCRKYGRDEPFVLREVFLFAFADSGIGIIYYGKLAALYGRGNGLSLAFRGHVPGEAAFLHRRLFGIGVDFRPTLGQPVCDRAVPTFKVFRERFSL